MTERSSGSTVAAASAAPLRKPPAVSFERRPFYEIVCAVLSGHIRSGLIVPGTVIREKAVREAFGIGRVPVSIALDRLEAERLVHRRPPMHGVVVGLDVAGKLAADGLDFARLSLPREVEAELKIRNWRTLIYPQVEREVASCLLFGRFQIRSQVLAEHFGVSRTVANELLLRLERVGLVVQEANARWYAGPLTPRRIKDLYELRILLEPRALRQGFASIDRQLLQTRLERIIDAETMAARSDTTLLHRLEVDLHQDIVLRCTNLDLRTVLYRCQIPLISVHLSFGSYDAPSDIPQMIGDHRRVLEHLGTGDLDRAAEALADHLARSSDSNPGRLAGLRPIDPRKLSRYLDPV